MGRDVLALLWARITIDGRLDNLSQPVSEKVKPGSHLLSLMVYRDCRDIAL